jgi:hypothetical protein
MIFILLIFLAALTIEGIGTYVSILGLSDTFKGDNVILSMAIVLDFTKLVLISLLYKYWKSVLMKSLLIPMAGIMMIITSAGVAGYMSGSFQQAMTPNTEIAVKLDTYSSEHSRLLVRKSEMDKQISQMPENYVTARQRLMESFAPELDKINSRIYELDTLILDLKTQSIEADAHLGPIVLVSKVFGIDLDTAVSIIIGLIVFVFDPLAVLLVLNGNMLIERRKTKSEEVKSIIDDQQDDEVPLVPKQVQELKLYQESDTEIAEPQETNLHEPEDDEDWEDYKKLRSEIDEINEGQDNYRYPDWDTIEKDFESEIDEPITSVNEIEDLKNLSDDKEEVEYIIVPSALDNYKLNNVNPDVELSIKKQSDLSDLYSKDTL